MSRRILSTVSAIMITFVSVFSHGCIHKPTLPTSAELIAEDQTIAVFLNKEDKNEIPQVSLWLKRKESGDVKQILLSHPRTKRGWMTTKRSITVPMSSIPTVSKVTILSYNEAPVRLLVEGCVDYRNVESYIITDTSSVAVCLPTNRGLLGLSEEENLLIMQSYQYYDQGCRYNLIEAFDNLGNRIATMNPQLHPELNKH